MAEHDIEKIVEAGGEVFNFRDPTKQPVADRVTSIRAASSATDTKYPTEKAVRTELDKMAPGAITTEAVVANGDKLLISDVSDNGKIKRMSGVTFDAATKNRFLSRNGTFEQVLEADLEWGGVFRTSKAPVENFALQNVFFGPKPSAISVEYSNNRTSDNPTWTDYGLTDAQKMSLLSGTSFASVYCGKKIHCHPGYTGNAEYKDLSNENIADQGLRITICCRSLTNRTTDTDSWVYCSLRRILMYMSTQSAGGGAHCVVEKQNGTQYKENSDTWTTLGDYKIQGDSGWNSIPYNGAFGGGWTQTSNYSWVIRFTIWSDTLSANPHSGQTGCLLIERIVALSSNVWGSTGARPPMQVSGVPYTVDYNGKATFADIAFTARKLKTNLARTSDSTFDGSADQLNIPVTGTLPVGNGGTGKTTAKAAEYNLTTGKSEISDTTSGDDRVVFELASPSESNGVTRGFRKLSTIWTWIKGLLSSESGVNISGNASGLSSTLAVGSGGTGRTSVTSGNYVVGAGTSALVEKTPKEVGSDVLSHLDTDNHAVQDSDYIVASGHEGAQVDTTSFVRRTAVQLWTYIAYKIYSVLGLTASAYDGKSATAGTADTAKAYDPTFSGTNSIASALESKVTEIAFTEGNGSAATDLTNVVLCGLKYNGSSLSSGRLSFTLSVTINRGASSKGGILRVDLAIGPDGSIYCKRASLTARSGGLEISEFRLVTGTNGGKPVVGVVWNGTTTFGAYMDVRVIDYMALSASASFVYDAVLSNVSIVIWGSSNAIQSASDSDVVHISGSETITGAKEFSRSGQETNFTDSSGSESIVRARTSTSSNYGSCQLNADRTTHRFGVYGRNENGTSKWISFVGNDGVVNLGSYGDEVRIGGTKFVFNASQLGTEADTFYWI